MGYHEDNVGGRHSLIYIDWLSNIYIVAAEHNGVLILEEGYDHGRDYESVEIFRIAYGLRRRR